MKPENAFSLSISTSLCYAAIFDMATLLPPAKFYRLLVSDNPYLIRMASELLGEHGNNIKTNPLCPSIGLEIDKTLENEEWMLGVDDNFIWNGGL